MAQMKRREMMRRSHAAYVAKYPERYVAYWKAMEDPQPCDTCGGEARPWFGPHPGVELLAWRCYVCRHK